MDIKDIIPNFIEPGLVKKGDDRLKLGRFSEAPLVDCRVLSEDNYQLLINTIISLSEKQK
jgi:hypothetical protein